MDYARYFLDSYDLFSGGQGQSRWRLSRNYSVHPYDIDMITMLYLLTDLEHSLHSIGEGMDNADL